MDKTVPGTTDPVPNRTEDPPYPLERVDLDDLLGLLGNLEGLTKSTRDAATLSSVASEQARTSLEKLIGKTDSIESGFNRISERSLLPISWLETYRKRSIGVACEELAEQLKTLQQTNAEQAATFQAERDSLSAEILNLRSALQEAKSAAAIAREHIGILEGELQDARAQIANDSEARRTLEARNAELSEETEKKRAALVERAEEIQQESARRIGVEHRDVKTLEERHALQVAALLEGQVTMLRNLEEARSNGENLKSQIGLARSESEEMRRALKEKKEKTRLLRAQVSERDRIIQNHITKADGDRAVLEQQLFEFRTAVATSEERLREARSQTEVALADAKSLGEELQRVRVELREMRRVEATLRADLQDSRASQSGCEQRLKDNDHLIAQLLDVAIGFRNIHVRATATASALNLRPVSGGPQTNTNADDVTVVPRSGHAVLGPQDEPSPIDPSDPQAALETLKAVDHDRLLVAVSKMGSTLRKWQKHCKEYRDRARAKISFRNFAEGDLALFLPTRNSKSKPWAAFNVSHPHHFLQGNLTEEVKAREWIVARISLITEYVVDSNDPSSNPYQLGDGVKYYMVEIENWAKHTRPRLPRHEHLADELPPQ